MQYCPTFLITYNWSYVSIFLELKDIPEGMLQPNNNKGNIPIETSTGHMVINSASTLHPTNSLKKQVMTKINRRTLTHLPRQSSLTTISKVN